MTTDGLDPEAFRHLLDITGGDLEFVDELIDTYIDDATVQLAAMREAAANGDVDAMIRPAHSLKSSSACVGALQLADACDLLERLARDESSNTAEIPRHATEVLGRSRRVIAELALRFGAPEPELAGRPSRSPTAIPV